jgi:hypothetical protein
MTPLVIVFFLLFACIAGIVWGIPIILTFFMANTPDEKEMLDNDIKRARIKQATVNYDLALARKYKVMRDNEVLDSRQGKLENEILILEEKLDKLRREKGQPFEPFN